MLAPNPDGPGPKGTTDSATCTGRCAPLMSGAERRFGLRLLTHNPSFAAAAIVVVALRIGATTAVFSVVRGALLQPLPYREPNRIVLFRADGPGLPDRRS